MNLGRLAQAFNKMNTNLKKMIGDIILTSEQVAAASEELLASGEQVGETAEQVGNNNRVSSSWVQKKNQPRLMEQSKTLIT